MNILFLCTGNTCRSPMAEVLLKAKLKEKLAKNCVVKSCGMMASIGQPANPFAIEVAKENGYDLSKFRSSQFDSEYLEWADVIVCMTPELSSRVNSKKCVDFCSLYRLSPISDPYGGSKFAYRNTFSVINFACELFAEDIVNGTIKKKLK